MGGRAAAIMAAGRNDRAIGGAHMTEPTSRTDPAESFRRLVDDVDQGRLTRAEAVGRASTEALIELFHPTVALDELPPLLNGTPASPGIGSGAVCLSTDAVFDAVDEGRPAVLVVPETTPEDVAAMRLVEAILTSRGGQASHAAVVARGWGIPAVVGAPFEIDGHFIRAGAGQVGEGEDIVVDGTHGVVRIGSIPEDGSSRSALPDAVQKLLSWADEVRAGRVEVCANADHPDDVAVAFELGAEGVGLCRTEHMFLAPDRLPLVRAVLSRPGDDVAVRQLREAQRDDVVALLGACGSAPLRIRLLDAPFHEFVPDHSEHNPMLGLRGVRLALVRPEILDAQVDAITDAVRAADGQVTVEVMVPLVALVEEIDWVRRRVGERLAALGIRLGVMIETPRSALLATRLVDSAEFISIGTNDLTQLTFGFSRDDLVQDLLPEYLRLGVLNADPFGSLDRHGVGELVASVVRHARVAGAPVGVCGEHAGDPSSIAFLVEAGVGSLSCSPYRVPVARLAAAQAVLAGGPGS
jgi:pyruvate,orthophosphate dikinase